MTQCRMNVYQGVVIDWKRSTEPHHGQCRACIAAKSWRAAHAVVVLRYPNMTINHMRRFWTITGNPAQIAAATAHPGKLMLASTSVTDADYEPVPDGENEEEKE